MFKDLGQKLSCKGKVLPVHDMKAHGRVKVYHHSFLTLVPDTGEWSALRTGHFIICEMSPGTQ
jgi:hypothetical protein